MAFTGFSHWTDGNKCSELIVAELQVGQLTTTLTGGGFYFLDTAITANTTVTTAVKGSLATTSHATGAGKLFISDGSKWQFPAVA